MKSIQEKLAIADKALSEVKVMSRIRKAFFDQLRTNDSRLPNTKKQLIIQQKKVDELVNRYFKK